MRTWLIAMAMGGALTGLSRTASAQAIQRAGGGTASVACAFDVGTGPINCLLSGTSQQILSTPDGTASVINNVKITGMSGGSQVTMSAISIRASGNAAFAPPPGCDSGRVGGQGPTYSANGSQSVYADVPNGTPIRITINASASGTGGGGASWSDVKSGAGGISGTTVFDAAAGPGKIAVSGVDYYLIDTISASGVAGARFICDAANSQSFDGSVNLSFCVAAGKMKAVSSPGVTAVVNTPIKLKVQVNNGCTNAPLSGQTISFSTISVPAGGGNVSLAASALTDANGLATVSFAPGSATGVYSVRAFCPTCGADRQVTFTVTAITLKQAIQLIALDCGGNGFLSNSLPNGIRVQAINTVTGRPALGYQVNFLLLSSPGGTGISLTPAPVTTDGNGIAHASLAFGDIPGVYNVNATCQDCEGNQQVTCQPSAIPRPDLPVPATNIPIQRLRNSGISASVSPPSVSPQQTNGNHIANINIQGAPQTGFTATVSAIPFTGGHQHDVVGRPLGTLSAQSSFTDASGNATLAYTAGEVGGLEMISIQTTDGAQADAVVTATVDPVLNRLPVSPSYRTNSNDGKHPNFQYGTANLIAAIDLMANHYMTDYTTRTMIISLNDMSLINGGLLDVDGTWTAPHVSHRKGIDVDVNSRPVRSSGRLGLDAQLVDRLDVIIQRFGLNCTRVPEEPIHYRCP